jgi:hypothetical protein
LAGCDRQNGLSYEERRRGWRMQNSDPPPKSQAEKMVNLSITVMIMTAIIMSLCILSPAIRTIIKYLLAAN